MAGLNVRQSTFVDLYCGECEGNATEAYMRAYGVANRRTAEANGERLLRHAEVQQAVRTRLAARPEIATREERQAFWSSLMRGVDPYDKGDGAVPIKDRLKASELLGKTHLDFKEVVVHEGVIAHDVKVDLSGLSDAALAELAGLLKGDK